MSRNLVVVPLLLLAAGLASADDPAEAGDVVEAAQKEARADAPAGTKELSGMSILGNQEAPKSLVIVPWKTSELGTALGISAMLDDSRQSVDKEVFMRALSYYEIRSEKTP
jgi:hypothetical protein